MKQNSILGEGTYAIVVGPFSLSFVTKTGFFHNLPSTPQQQSSRDRYIIKIYKREVENASELFQKQQLYTQLEKTLQHHTILFPLSISIRTGKEIVSYFPFMGNTLEESKQYQLEVERYGGTSLEKVMFHKDQPILNVSKFLKIWRCIPNILEDSFTVLFHNHLIMTDIKIENIVLSSYYQLCLIDVDLNPNKRTSRIITPYITELPPQYFSQEWWHPHYAEAKKTLLQRYTNHYREYKKEKKIISKIFDFIHHYQDPSFLIKNQRLTQEENKFQRLFFVMYPLYMMILGLVVYHCVKIQTIQEKERVKRILSFCLDMLQKRGHFSSTFSYKTFQDFIWKMKTL